MSGSKRKCFSIEEKTAILHRLEAGESNITIAKELGVAHSTISSIKKNKDKIEPLFNANVLKCKRIRGSTQKQIDQALLQWVNLQRNQGIHVSGPTLQEKANYFAQELNIPDFSCSMSWINRFKVRHNIVSGCSDRRMISDDVNERDDTITMTSTDTYQLKWHSHSSHLNGSVAALLRSERFTDVVLCTMDGSQIPAHKFILSSCSVYLSNLFEGQRSVTRMGGMLYVVLPSEISTKALKILVEYMYKGETTVSNEVLDTVLKAGEVLKIRGLWRQTDEAGGDSTPAEKTTAPMATASVNKQIVAKKPEDMQPKITVKKDDKLLKTFGQVQPQGVTRPMFIGPPKLVFIKTTEGGTQAALRPGAPKGQTILVAPAQTADSTAIATTVAAPAPVQSVAVATIADDSPDEAPPPRILRRHAAERKYGKKQRVEASTETEEAKDDDNQDNVSVTSKKSTQSNLESTEVHVKDEPEWDASSIEEEERSIAEMFQAEMSVKSEPIDDMEIEEESLMYSPLACELCAEVFTVPAAWVRHVQGHAHQDQPPARKRKHRSASDDTEETMALLRCDLCQKHFPNPAEWVRHIQSTHTETELAISNNSAPPKRHNRFTEGAQNKNCTHCKKAFPSHASMLIHLRTHTGERPFICGLCNKGFNVKSNLLRHLRTLHDQLISPAQVEGDDSEESTSAPGPSEVKRES
ncbi:zinc finger and BTB domain-containing protein 17 isoform X2 [Achroia grisella]|uniref:zinc finger and BTB domain-containing protein 17 isoform X2 n=1 Tax=Achroia grisella TaxID=688607 RepID=UPI0027D20D17|nr:zinc finger and BTB domain-containing protein 17 isoform X2 [Achroia grisella]